MKIRLQLVAAVAALAVTGCAYLHSTTKKSTDPQTKIEVVKTSVRSYTLFDSNAQLTKFNNRGETVTSNAWAAGTYIGMVNQSATSTNLNDIIGTVVGAAVKAAVKP